MADTMTKIVACGGVALIGYITYNKVVNDKSKPERRKHRQALTLSDMDSQIDNRNSAFGQKVPANPDVPFYSRHNYNRRRRPNHLF